ncbi:7735_t:CDS:2 [Rhizophagus irregularis]|nr:7735_t:CDS:2 [Rhizophagus irregularis]
MNNSDLSIEGKSICEDTDNLIKDSTVNIENDQEFLGWTPYEKFKQNIKKSCKLMISDIVSDAVEVVEIFIAANFYNNEDILPNFSEQLLELVQILGPENVYISIFENGSKDNTKLFLQTLQSTLNSIDIANTIIIDDTPKYYIGRRIPYLANLRNRVLEPLLEQAEKENHFDKVLFFNDIIWKVSDILTLLRTNGYSYDAACAMDFYWTFYDTFATRELPSPNISYPWPPTPYYPFFYDTTAQQQIYNGESVQVFSCWNGVVIMNAEPFVKHGIKFRALMPQDKELPFEASECCLIFSDFKKVGDTNARGDEGCSEIQCDEIG